ncbi:MAG: SURF1 family protein [Hyphomicrobiaceae bacterium]
MIARLRQSGLIWPTLATAAALAVLLALGTWQWQRKNWKDDLVQRIVARTVAEPVSIDAALALATRTGGDIEYLRVAVEGRFLHGAERYFYATAGPGWHVVTPLDLGDGRRIWVNRGFVPEALRDPEKRPDGQGTGPTRIVGLVRYDAPADAFTPANDPQRNIWYRRDIAALDASAFPPTSPRSVGFLVEAEATQAPGGWPKGGVTRLALPNRHLEYALTWWGLAATLIGVFVAFAWPRWKAGNRA